MRVKCQSLKAGSVLAEDVYGKTGRPIIYKDTVLVDKHIQVLKSFLIDDVEITAQQSEIPKYDSQRGFYSATDTDEARRSLRRKR